MQTQGGIGDQQLGHAAVVIRSRLSHPQLVFRQRGAELGGQARTSATLRIREQMADLCDRQRRDDQTGPVLPQELCAAAVVAVTGI